MLVTEILVASNKRPATSNQHHALATSDCIVGVNFVPQAAQVLAEG